MKAQGECTVDIVKVLILNMSGSCEFIRALKFNIISVCDINICILDPLRKTTTSEISFALIIHELCKKIASQEIIFPLKFTLFGLVSLLFTYIELQLLVVHSIGFIPYCHFLILNVHIIT